MIYGVESRSKSEKSYVKMKKIENILHEDKTD